jgi:NitT/TauT family transport system ATP-binding protein
MIGDSGPVSTDLISASSLGKIFDQGGVRIEAVSTVSFAVKSGEFVSILGPSGCGKSTLLMMVAGLESSTSGVVSIAGKPVDRPRQDVSVVFQDAVLLPWKSVLENTLFPAHIQGKCVDAYRDRATKLLHSVGLNDFSDKRPHQLSGGMKQRVALCRALINDPDVLLMDEPFSALDAVTRDQMNIVLMSLWQEIQKTALFVTHSIREAVFLSDRILVMGKRPSTVIFEQVVDFQRPRRFEIEESPEFNAICGVLRRKMDEAA